MLAAALTFNCRLDTLLLNILAVHAVALWCLAPNNDVSFLKPSPGHDRSCLNWRRRSGSDHTIIAPVLQCAHWRFHLDTHHLISFPGHCRDLARAVLGPVQRGAVRG